MFKIQIDSSKKVFKVEASGFLTKDDLVSYIDDFKKNLKNINPSQFALVVDAREQKALAPDAAGLIGDVLKMYSETPFKKRFSVVLDSAVAMSQVKRVAKDSVDNFIMVDSVEEAYKNL